MNSLEKLTLIESTSFSEMGNLATEYIEYWSAKLGMEETEFFKKLNYYISITLSKKIADDHAVVVDLFQEKTEFNDDITDWREDG